jgi:hypothetical protein
MSGEVDYSLSERAILRDVDSFLLDDALVEDRPLATVLPIASRGRAPTWEPAVRPDWDNPAPRMSVPDLVQLLRDTDPRRSS